jgi:predicted nucleic acid-binding protein
VAETWIVNASPLISLDRAGVLHLLSEVGRDIVVPPAVVAEVGKGPKPLTPAQLGPHRIVTIAAIHPIVAAWDLGLGESEVLSLAASTQGDVVALVDDRAARRCATALGVRTRGTLHVVLESKRLGIIPAVAPVIDRLRAAGLYLSEQVVSDALKIAAE